MDELNHGIVEHVSPLGVEATLVRLTAAIAQAGLTILARIDHAANARDAGLAMPPAVVLVYGHAKGGTPLMLAAPRVALDLPLRVLVREDADRGTLVAFHPVAAAMAAAGVPNHLVARLEPAQRLLVEAIRS